MSIEDRSSRILWVAVAVVATGYIGVGLPYPVLAPLLLGPGGGGLVPSGVTPETAFGLIIALYPLGMFFGNQFLGRLADALGRKRALMISISGSALGYLLTGYAIYTSNFVLLLLSRAGTGFFEGNVPIARAIAADLAPAISKEKSFGLISGAVYFGYLVGPLVGGFMGADDPTAPFVAAGILFAGIILSVMLLLPNDKPLATGESAHVAGAWSLLRLPIARNFFIASLLASLAISLFYQCFPIILVRDHAFGPVLIGWISFVLTAALLITSIWGLRLVKRFAAPRRTIITCSILLAALLMVVGIAADALPLWIAFVGIGCCIPLVQTNIAILASDQLGPEVQGRWMGLLGAGGAFGATVVILLGSIASALDAALPMLAASVLAIVSALYIALIGTRRDSEPAASLAGE